MNIFRYRTTGSERSLEIVAGSAKKVRPRYISPEEGKRIVAMRQRGMSIRQIWVALRAQGRYTEEDIFDHIEGWRREEGFVAGIKLAGSHIPPMPPFQPMRRAAA